MVTDSTDPAAPHWAACAHTAWYPLFEKITARSISIAMPAEVHAYLLTDPIILPRECSPYIVEVTTSLPTITITGHTPDGAGPPADDPFADDDSLATDPPDFSDFSNQITAAIAALGGAAFPKTNWQAPKDALWIIAGQVLRVNDIVDVYQLLKASECTRHDLDRAPADAQVLVLREFIDVHPGTEFRCYVRDKSLIAISPRDWPQFHGHILGQKREIISDIRTMFLEHIKQRFPLNDYYFDVIRDRKDSVSLVDFGPFGRQHSDPLAFDWDELEQLDAVITDDDPEFRYLSVDTGIQPSSKRNNYGIPRDIIEVYQAGTIDPPDDRDVVDDDDDDDEDRVGTSRRRPGGRQTLEELFGRLMTVSEQQQQQTDVETADHE